ncbi:Surface polysaccharide O-acyltransferase, integral membrane enzyme [Mucilaginibacter gossypiicola]|uniref:Surface polysaccharide O-acyltransferase, integral membrane enzyme n=1 Tax=Mucilaginibacter gossypiicola TaxID=551995 RepID=A0A1H8RVX6_9SPHI|nr:acyltransferase [Mucilaginibacter gossypiicola]SEO70601.1 Surface polysaccharide O-acyltransferase, integral membrane enzyme [Mucilaginibacter gossypiicola]
MQLTDTLPTKNNTTSSTPSKLLYIDNLKIVLTILVVLHHTFITYGAPGGWYFTDKTTNDGAIIPMTLLVSVNQSFFMGFFFFISAYFTASSFQNKGAVRFTADRLKRLGIPLLFYSFILSPVLSYIVYRFARGHQVTYFQYLSGFDGWIDFGVLWFVAALLLFSLVFVLFNTLLKTRSQQQKEAPSALAIILFAAVLGIASYFARIFFPVGWVLKPIGFQLGHFPQYIAMFWMGITASRNNWLQSLDLRTGRLFAWLVAFMILVLFPIIYFIKESTNSSIEELCGQGHWQSLMYACWEQFTGVFIMAALLIIAKHRWTVQSAVAKNMSRAAFGVYVFHPLVLISLSVTAISWPVDPAYKLLIVAPLAVTGSFLLSMMLVKIPGINKFI